MADEGYERSGIPPAWPEKKRELHNHHFDSTIWNGFEFRDDDIVRWRPDLRSQGHQRPLA